MEREEEGPPDPVEFGKISLIITLIGKPIAELFKFSPKDLASFRLVCKEWNHESLSFWRNIARLSIVQTKSNENELDIDEFLKIHKRNALKLQTVPFQHYKFRKWNLDTVDNKLFTCLIQNINPDAIDLQIVQCSSREYVPRQLHKALFQNLPKLEKLSFKNCDIITAMDTDDIPDDAKRFFRDNTRAKESVTKLEANCVVPTYVFSEPHIFPNLSEIEINGDNMTMVLCIIANRNMLGNFPKMNIRKIDISPETWRKSDLLAKEIFSQSFRKAKFPLEYLSLPIHFCNEWSVIQQRILKAYRKKLKFLRIYRRVHVPCLMEEINFDFKMIAIKELHFIGNVEKDFRFLKLFPNVEKVYIDKGGYDIWNGEEDFTAHEKEGAAVMEQAIPHNQWIALMPPGTIPLIENLTYLRVDALYGKFELQFVRMWAPNLKAIHMMFDNQSLMCVPYFWLYIEEIGVLHGSKVDDDGLPKPMPFLKNFKLEANCGMGKLTNVSVDKFFMGCPSLMSVDICVSPQMSIKAEAMLRGRIMSVNVNRNYGNHVGTCCHRMKYEKSVGWTNFRFDEHDGNEVGDG